MQVGMNTEPRSERRSDFRGLPPDSVARVLWGASVLPRSQRLDQATAALFNRHGAFGASVRMKVVERAILDEYDRPERSEILSDCRESGRSVPDLDVNDVEQAWSNPMQHKIRVQ